MMRRLVLIFLACLIGRSVVTVAQAPTAAQAAFNDPTVQQLIDTSDPLTSGGKARLTILAGKNDVQTSNYGRNSFQCPSAFFVNADGPERSARSTYVLMRRAVR